MIAGILHCSFFRSPCFCLCSSCFCFCCPCFSPLCNISSLSAVVLCKRAFLSVCLLDNLSSHCSAALLCCLCLILSSHSCRCMFFILLLSIVLFLSTSSLFLLLIILLLSVFLSLSPACLLLSLLVVLLLSINFYRSLSFFAITELAVVKKYCYNFLPLSLSRALGLIHVHRYHHKRITEH